MCLVHWEAMEHVLFIRSQPSWTEQPMETRPGVLQNGGNGLVFDRPHSKRDPIHREGSGVPQNGGNRLVLERYGRNGGPVHQEGCGVPQNGTPWDTVHLHRRPPPASTSYCSSIHPPSTVHPTLHGVVLFIQPSTGSCSSSPNRLDRSGSCSSIGNTTRH